MSNSGIQGQVLKVRVIECNSLKNTETLPISRQDPYVRVDYGSTSYSTKSCTDGGKYPTFQADFIFTLIEGVRELNLTVWNKNMIVGDYFIGSGKVQLQKVLSDGYDDTRWPIQTQNGRQAGYVRLILYYENAIKPAPSFAPSAPSEPMYVTPAAPQVPSYSTPPPAAAFPYPLSGTAYLVPFPYPPNPAAYPTPSQLPTYPPQPYPPSAYPPQPYPPSAYPPQPYPPSAYPPQPYPPSAYPPQPYPPPPQATIYYPPGPYLGTYPPPPYS